MANLVIDDDTVTVALSTVEKVEAIHGNVTVPRSAITGVREVLDGMREVHGLRVPGTGVPGVILAGTFRQPGRTTFAICHGRRPAIVLDLTDEQFDRIVLTVDNPAAAIGTLF